MTCVLIICRAPSYPQAALRVPPHFGGGLNQSALHRENQHTAVSDSRLVRTVSYIPIVPLSAERAHFFFEICFISSVVTHVNETHDS